MDYDLMVIGDAREGMERAISVAGSGRHVAVIGSPQTTTSLEFMRLAMNILIEQQTVTMSAWRAEVARLAHCQTIVDDSELEIAGVERIDGRARFLSPTTVEVTDGPSSRVLSGREIIVACGTKSRLPAPLRGDERFVLSLETLLNLDEIPRSIVVVGAGKTGISSAIVLATLGVEVIVVDEHVSLPELNGIIVALLDTAPSLKIAFRLGDEVIGTELRADLTVAARLASGKHLVADAVLVCVGREGQTNGLDLEEIGVGIDERGRLWCDTTGQTWISSISAVGDVVGFPRTGSQLQGEAIPYAHVPISNDALYMPA